MSDDTITINRSTFLWILAQSMDPCLSSAIVQYKSIFNAIRMEEYDLSDYDEIAAEATNKLQEMFSLPNGHEDKDALESIQKDISVEPRQAYEWIFGAGGGYEWMVFKDKHKNHQGSVWLADFENENDVKILSLSKNVDWCWSPDEERYVFINLTRSETVLVRLAAIGEIQQKDWDEVESGLIICV